MRGQQWVAAFFELRGLPATPGDLWRMHDAAASPARLSHAAICPARWLHAVARCGQPAFQAGQDLLSTAQLARFALDLHVLFSGACLLSDHRIACHRAMFPCTYAGLLGNSPGAQVCGRQLPFERINVMWRA